MEDCPPEAAANLYRSRRLALMGIVGGIVVGFALGVPVSLMRGRGAAPWEPVDILNHGARWAAIITVGTVLIAYAMHRYVALYRKGRRVSGRVVSMRHVPGGPRGVVVQFTHNNATRFSWLPRSRLRVGAKITTIVGSRRSNLVLHDNAPHGFARSSVLTKAEVARIVAGGFQSNPPS